MKLASGRIVEKFQSGRQLSKALSCLERTVVAHSRAAGSDNVGSQDDVRVDAIAWATRCGNVGRLPARPISSGGEELEWLGDGALAAFSSSADAVRCAISIEQTARRPVAGARFEIRIGLHLGEVMRRNGGSFGLSVVTARRLCDRAASGQILCSKMIADLLVARAIASAIRNYAKLLPRFSESHGKCSLGNLSWVK